MAAGTPQSNTGPSSRPAEVRDPRALRALAHSTRLALLEVLAAEGSATATRCAELLGERVASCSFHLRTLARHGFIEPVPQEGGREKPWRLTSPGQSIPQTDLTPEQDMAAGEVLTTFLEREFVRLREWQQRVRDEPEQWQRAATMQGATVWLTPDELTELGEELRGLALRHQERVADPGRRPEGARPVRVFVGTSVGLPGNEHD